MVLFRMSGEDGAEVSPGCHASSPKLATFYSQRASARGTSDTSGTAQVSCGTPATRGHCQAPALDLSDLVGGGAHGEDSMPCHRQGIHHAGDGGGANTAHHPSRAREHPETTKSAYEQRLAGMSKIATNKERDTLLCVVGRAHQHHETSTGRGDKYRALAGSRGAFARWASQAQRSALASACTKQVLMGAPVHALLRQAAFRSGAARR